MKPPSVRWWRVYFIIPSTDLTIGVKTEEDMGGFPKICRHNRGTRPKCTFPSLLRRPADPFLAVPNPWSARGHSVVGVPSGVPDPGEVRHKNNNSTTTCFTRVASLSRLALRFRECFPLYLPEFHCLSRNLLLPPSFLHV